MTTTKYPKKIFKIGALQNNILTNADENYAAAINLRKNNHANA